MLNKTTNTNRIDSFVRSIFLSLIFTFILTITPAMAKEPLRIGNSKTILGITLNIAKQENLFGDLDVELVDLQFGKLIMDGVLNKEVDVGMLVDTNIGFIGFQKNNLKIVAAFGTQSGERLLLKTNETNLTPDLIKGKRIGYVPGTTVHAHMYYFLETVGMSIDDIQPIILNPRTMQPALQGDTVDGVIIWQPWVTNIKKNLGTDIKEYPRSEENFYLSNLYVVTRDDVLDDKKEDVQKLLVALKNAEDFIKTNPEKALNYTIDYLGLEKDIVEDLLFRDCIYHLEMAPRNIDILNRHAQWIKNTQREFKNKDIPDYLPMFDSSLLVDIFPERITLNK